MSLPATNRIYDVLQDRRGFSVPRGCVAIAPGDGRSLLHEEAQLDGEVIQGTGTAVETALYSPELFAYLKTTFANGIHTPHVQVEGTLAVEIGSANIGDTPSATAAGVIDLAIRDDALSTLADAEGKLVPRRVNSTGAQWVIVQGTQLSTGKVHAAFSAGDVDVGNALFYVRRDAPIDAASDTKYDFLQGAQGYAWTRPPDPRIVTVTATLDTSAYAAGDLIADTQEIAAAVITAAGGTYLTGIEILDEDNQGAAIDIFFSSASTSFGTENSAPNITDANLRNAQGHVRIDASHWVTISGAKMATWNGKLGLRAAAASTSLYFAVVSNASTPTYTASGLQFKFKFSEV